MNLYIPSSSRKFQRKHEENETDVTINYYKGELNRSAITQIRSYYERPKIIMPNFQKVEFKLKFQKTESFSCPKNS